jgi:2-polyprenyl-3-methyl-5-hydroxy-6-metoxy-1,4-benzoquinol methylase
MAFPVYESDRSGTVKAEAYVQKDRDYFTYVRHDVIDLVPPGNHRVLEVGCGRGATLLTLKELGRARETIGLDISSFDAPLDRCLVGDIEEMELPIEPGTLDVIICADVLEHLVDPWKVVGRLAELLRPGGLLISSIPNFRCDLALVPVLLHGDFGYKDAGVMDRTHLRFFCKKNALALMQEGGLRIRHVGFDLTGKRKLALRLSLGLAEPFLVVQYLIVSEKPQ